MIERDESPPKPVKQRVSMPPKQQSPPKLNIPYYRKVMKVPLSLLKQEFEHIAQRTLAFEEDAPP